MSKQTLYVLTEPAQAMPVWFVSAMDGLRDAALRRRCSVAQLDDPAQLDSVPEAPAAVVVISSQNGWTFRAVSALRRKGILPALVGTVPENFGSGISGVLMSRRVSTEKMLRYFVSCGRTRPALVGVNRNASNDHLKTEAFLRTAAEYQLSVSARDIFWIGDDITVAVSDLLRRAESYDGAICSNDYVAVSLIARAAEAGIRVPEQLFVSGMGGMQLGRYCSPTLTTTSPNEFFEMGVQAVNLWQLLTENPSLSSVVFTVDSDLIPRGSTGFSPPPSGSAAPQTEPRLPEIVIGPESQTLRNIENGLRRCDELDMQIIHGLTLGHSLEQLEAELFLAHTSLHYRLKKLYAAAGVGGRAELEGLLRFYLPKL